MQEYDAIVVGSGISGGWAAKELCEKGLKTLVLERGPNVEHIKDYKTASMDPWEFKYHLANPMSDVAESPIQSRVYDQGSKHFLLTTANTHIYKTHPLVGCVVTKLVAGH